jgi:predicted ATPase/DNA-binding CsgD family transcriptional regulator
VAANDLIGSPDDAEARLGNLPVALTDLLGREAALAELASVLWDTRLLALCGPGGAGKSRLALALAEAVRDDFIGGAWWVDLSSTVDGDLVARAVATALLPGTATSEPVTAISRQLSDTSLLVLDNCEQVVSQTADLVVDLLVRVPSLRIVVTSRQPLGIPGEHVWRVPGLTVENGLPPTEGAGPGEEGAATTLFMQRAHEANANFRPDAPGTRDAVVEICRWLDGMPLAIELAAARVAVLNVDLIAGRLKSDVGFLSHARRAAPGRHRTLQDTLDWSHRLLEPGEQRLFRRLGVFRGSFSLEAAERVCTDEQTPPGEILDLLSVLVDRSLLHVVDGPGRPRFRLLATVRQYARQKLEESGELDAARAQHADHYYQLGERAGAGLAGPDQLMWLEDLELDHDNISDALEWLFEHAPVRAAELAFALWPFSYQRGYYTEARGWFERALGLAARLHEPVIIEALLKAGEVSFLQCDYAVAISHLELALELIGPDGDRRAAATALQRLGSISREQARYEESQVLHGRSLEIWRALEDAEGVASSESYLAFVGWLAGDFATAREAGRRALAEFRAGGNLHETAMTLVNLGAGATYAGELDRAEADLAEALRISRRLGFQEGVAWSLHELAILARLTRRSDTDPQIMLRDALLVHQQLGDRWRIASVLEEIAGAALEREDGTLATQLLGCTEALREQIGAPVPPVERPDHEAAVARLRRRLGTARFARAWAEGRGQPLGQAIDGAVAAIDRGRSRDEAAAGGGLAPILTPREMAVLELLSQGQTNREIATSLFISTSTAGVHVSNILRKLRAKRRVDATTRAHALGLLDG